MTAPITCPACGSTDWFRTWSGKFYEEQYLTWQRFSTETYELTFDNEDQFDTDTEPWICANCNQEPPEGILEKLEEAW